MDITQQGINIKTGQNVVIGQAFNIEDVIKFKRILYKILILKIVSLGQNVSKVTSKGRSRGPHCSHNRSN